MNSEDILIKILIPLISSHPDLVILSKLMQTSRLMYKTILSIEMIWIILAKNMCCSYCFYQKKQISQQSSLKGATFWYEMVKAIESQRKIRRQWGLIFASQIFLKNGKKSIVQRSSNHHSAQRKFHAFQQGNKFKYHGSHLCHILDTFLLSDSATLLSPCNFFRHWHDLTDMPKKLRDDLINKDQVCSPSLSYGNIPPATVSQKIKIIRLSGWMELEGSRFPTRLQSNVSDLRHDVIEFSSQIPFRRGTVRIDDEDTNEREDGDDIDGKTNDSQPYTENMNDIYVLHAHHPSFSTSETALSLHYHNNSHERSMKIALDEDTVLTGKRIPNQRFQVAYCPQMISSMVLESLETLFNEFRGEPRRTRWNRIMELFRSVFRSPPPPQQLQRFQSSTDWLLHQLYLSVSGSAPTSSVVKWYTTFITDLNLSPPESRIVVVAICFDINGSIAHISGITSSKSAFRVFGN